MAKTTVAQLEERVEELQGLLTEAIAEAARAHERLDKAADVIAGLQNTRPVRTAAASEAPRIACPSCVREGVEEGERCSTKQAITDHSARVRRAAIEARRAKTQSPAPAAPVSEDGHPAMAEPLV